jgi:hypothetical protein
MSTSARPNTARRLAVAAAGAASLLAVGANAGADAACRSFSGRYAEQIAPDGCTSPFGLCIDAQYTGGPLHGTFHGVVTSLTPTADTATTSVMLFTTDTVATVEAWGKSGTLTIENAGAFATAGRGDIVDLQTIVGGTGDFTGASGTIRASGTFDSVTGTGTSRFVGTICTA